MSHRVSQALACLVLPLVLASGLARGQVVPVKPTYSGFFASSDRTMTFVFEAPDARATLVFIPVGEGHHGMAQGTTEKHWSGAPSGNPCRSGYHMYFEAGSDAARAIDHFMTRHLSST